MAAEKLAEAVLPLVLERMQPADGKVPVVQLVPRRAVAVVSTEGDLY